MSRKKQKDGFESDLPTEESVEGVVDTEKEPEVVQVTVPTVVARKRPPKNRLSAATSATVSFKGWFSSKVQSDPRLRGRGYKLNEILLFMRGLGLKEEETAQAYDRGLAAYFGK